MLRLAKEEAEKPEKEAKEQHQKLWEGMLRVSAAALTRGEPGLGVLIPEQFCCAVLCPWLQGLTPAGQDRSHLAQTAAIFLRRRGRH